MTQYSKSELEEFENILKQTRETIKKHNIQHGITLSLSPSDTIAVFADIHGDYETFQEGIDKSRQQNPTYYIFTGDYIDKGKNSMKSFMIALKMFINDPKHVIPLVGNHEQFLFFGFGQDLKHNTEILYLCREVISLLPICCYATCGNERKLYFGHGGYPFMYRKKFIHVPDEYEDVWKYLNKSEPEPHDKDELIYETNNDYNLTPSEYVNKLYDDLKEISARPIESPYKIHAYEYPVERLAKIKNELSKESPNTSTIEEAKKELTSNPWAYESFVCYINLYKSYLASLQRARDKVIDIQYYIGWSDMYVYEEIVKTHSTDEWLALLEKAKTDYTNHIRFEVHRHNLCYPESQLKKWMNDNKINMVIRGHEVALTECNIRDLNKGEEKRSPPSTKIDDNSRIYVCLHSTRSYSSPEHPEYDKYVNVPKYLIVGKDEMKVFDM